MKIPIPQIVLTLVLCVLGSSAILAQNPVGQSRSPFWDNVRFGGGLGLGFTNGGFNGSLSPTAIYQVNPQFAAGTSLIFNYAKFNDDKLLAYGGSLISLFNPIPAIQLSAEFEQLRIHRTFDDGTMRLEDNYWLPALFLGAGYTQGNVTVGLRYDVLFDNQDSIYADALMPFVRVFF
ncbi:MAG: alpha-ketoglutarate decarboxylase [Bacteroidota bacterium]